MAYTETQTNQSACEQIFKIPSGLSRRELCILCAVVFGMVLSFMLNNYTNSTEINTSNTSLQTELSMFTLYNSYKIRLLQYQTTVRCNDTLLAADPIRSAIYTQGSDTFYHGGYIRFNVVLYNGYGKPLITGGDHLRARLFNEFLRAYIRGTILDHENGTYTVTFQAVWIGLANLEVEVLYTKEIIATVIRLKRLWDFSDIFAKFSFMNHKDKTRCGPDYETVVRSSKTFEVCDFSYWHKSMRWFCARPNGILLCKHWVSIYRNWENFTNGINECEDELSKRDQTTIPSNISIRILPHTTKGKRKIMVGAHYKPCVRYNTSELWYKDNLTGYFFDDKWILMHCKGIRRFDAECLRNKTLVLWGDSTLYQWYRYIESKLKVISTFKCNVPIEGTHIWYQTNTCYYHKYNITLYFTGHNIPVTPVDMNNLYDFYTTNIFDEILRLKLGKEILLVIHLFAHFQSYNFDFYAAHILKIKNSLERLLEMDLSIKVFIKLPHTYRRLKQTKWMLHQNDFIGFIYTDIIRILFERLYDKVIVLDQKDATIAKRSLDLHPSKIIVEEMVLELLSYIC